VVDVEQRALRALEEHDRGWSSSARWASVAVSGDELLEAMAEREVLVAHRLAGSARVARERAQAQAAWARARP
jgi:hypothetical protein